jgi:hypothetical protein
MLTKNYSNQFMFVHLLLFSVCLYCSMNEFGLTLTSVFLPWILRFMKSARVCSFIIIYHGKNIWKYVAC